MRVNNPVIYALMLASPTSTIPLADHGVQLTIDNALIGSAADAATALLQEFPIKKISRAIPTSATPNVQASPSVQP